ncbi:MAG: hypothetical protein ACK527_20185 [Acidobacteriota bacterium]
MKAEKARSTPPVLRAFPFPIIPFPIKGPKTMNTTISDAEARRVQHFLRELDEQVARDETEAQQAAQRAATNRENAAKSTGPRTPEGKAASSKNRLAHGLCSASLILHGECEADFDELRRQTHSTFAPVTPEELLFTDQLVEATWRLNRARRVETQALNQINVETAMNIMRLNGSTNTPSPEMSLAASLADQANQKLFATIQRYVTANERTYRACLKSLQDAIKRRRPQPETQPVPAVTAKPKVAVAGQSLYREEDTELPAWPAPAVPSFTDRC